MPNLLRRVKTACSFGDDFAVDVAVRVSSQLGGQFSRVGRLKVHFPILACINKIACSKEKG